MCDRGHASRLQIANPVNFVISANEQLAREANLDTANGIVIDEACRTCDPAIFAGGDVAITRLDNGALHHMDIEIVSFQRRQCTSNKQQRITRQEWRYHQPRFAEQNQKQNGINPDAVLRDQLCQMHVNVHLTIIFVNYYPENKFA